MGYNFLMSQIQRSIFGSFGLIAQITRKIIKRNVKIPRGGKTARKIRMFPRAGYSSQSGHVPCRDVPLHPELEASLRPSSTFGCRRMRGRRLHRSYENDRRARGEARKKEVNALGDCPRRLERSRRPSRL